MEAPLPSETDKLAWNIILTHGVSLFDGKMISTLARVSRDYDTILCQTAECRKNYFIEHDENLKAIKDTVGIADIVWHKYGAACGRMAIGKASHWPLTPSSKIDWPSSDPKFNGIVIERRYLGGSSKPWGRVHQGYHYSVPCESPLFFDTAGNLSGYYMTDRDKYYSAHKLTLTNELDSMKNCEITVNKCCIVIDNQLSIFNLGVFCEFPVLLQAVLTTARRLYVPGMVWDTVFDLQTITIPENYKEHKQYSPNKNFPDKKMHRPFDKLPKDLREAVDALYQKQKRIT